MFEVFEVSLGKDRSYFGDKQTAKDKADWMYDTYFDGIPFLDHHKFENNEQLVEFLNKTRGLVSNERV
jgi:hypothetical protein